jgi:hypothetical protein
MSSDYEDNEYRLLARLKERRRVTASCLVTLHMEQYLPWTSCARYSLPDFLYFMIRQVPTPSADAWSLGLASHDGPRFVVLRLDEGDARQRLAEHLVWLGKSRDDAEGLRLLADIDTERVAVIW